MTNPSTLSFRKPAERPKNIESQTFKFKRGLFVAMPHLYLKKFTDKHAIKSVEDVEVVSKEDGDAYIIHTIRIYVKR